MSILSTQDSIIDQRRKVDSLKENAIEEVTDLIRDNIDSDIKCTVKYDRTFEFNPACGLMGFVAVFRFKNSESILELDQLCSKSIVESSIRIVRELKEFVRENQ